MSTFTVIEEQLRQILELLSTTFSESEAKEVVRFIDVGEYGIALETLCSILDEEKKSVSHEVYNQIDDVGRRMLMDPTIWGRLCIADNKSKGIEKLSRES